MNQKPLIDLILPTIETELQRQIARLDEPRTRPFHKMLTYHMGWSGAGSGPEAQGKRIRPLLLLLTVAANGTDWLRAAPAAAAVELIHNFSLVHDDIQDNSDLRRGRETIWKKWGLAQGINAGDALFILAHLALFDLREKFTPEQVFGAGQVIQNACLDLTRGQFMDMSYESRTDLNIEDYWPMVAGKTAALLAACTHIGAILGGADESTCDAYRDFGHYLGLAFQVQDDYLGIWGDSALTGKSTESDLVAGKKSLPVLYGLEKAGAFAERWRAGSIQVDEAAALSQKLIQEGAQLYTREMVDQMTDLAMQALRLANPQGEAGQALYDLARRLLRRES